MKVQPLQFIVPYPKDGGSDKRMRLLCKYLAAELHVEVEVTNCVGASRGHEAIASAPPDGRCIGMISNEIGMMHWLDQSTARPEMFTPLALPFVEAAALIVSAGSPLISVNDLIGKARSGSVTGTGSPHYGIWKLALVGLFETVGVDQRHLRWLPTISGEEGLELVIKGDAEVAPVSLIEAPELIAQGKVRPIATMGHERHPLFPRIPTIREAIGVDWTMATWRGVAGPAGMPRDEIRRLRDALKAVSADAQFTEECMREGYMLDWRFGSTFGEFMNADNIRFREVFKSKEVRAGMVGH